MTDGMTEAARERELAALERFHARPVASYCPPDDAPHPVPVAAQCCDGRMDELRMLLEGPIRCASFPIYNEAWLGAMPVAALKRLAEILGVDR